LLRIIGRMVLWHQVIQTEGSATVIVGALFAVVWKDGESSLDDALVLSEALRQRCAIQPMALMVVLLPGAKPPQGEARRLLMSTMQELTDRIVARAMVIEAGGFLGATARAVGVGMSLISMTPTKFTESKDEALAFLRKHVPFHESEARQAIASLRRAN
jgi:hypothetical protein